MSLPTSITSASDYDQSSDDPKQARAQLKGLRDDVDAINSHLKTSALTSGTNVLGVGDGLQATGGNLVVQANGTTLDVSGAGIKLADNPVMPGTSGMRAPEGTTAQRPGQPHAGTLRYNTTTSKLEVFEGGAWHAIIRTVGDWEEHASSPFTPSGDPYNLSDVFTEGSKSYMVVLDDVRFVSVTDELLVRVLTAAGPVTNAVYGDVTQDNQVSSVPTHFTLGNISHGDDEGAHGALYINAPGGAPLKHFWGSLHHRAGVVGNQAMPQVGGTVVETSALTGLRFYSLSGGRTWASASRIRVFLR